MQVFEPVRCYRSCLPVTWLVVPEVPLATLDNLWPPKDAKKGLAKTLTILAVNVGTPCGPPSPPSLALAPYRSLDLANQCVWLEFLSGGKLVQLAKPGWALGLLQLAVSTLRDRSASYHAASYV